MYEAQNSRYTYKGTDVLKNKLNINNKELLDEYQNRMVAFKLSTIIDKKFGTNFDENRLKQIHKYLFEDIYDFAGEYRLENITKDNFRFAEYQYIDENIHDIMKNIDINKYKSLSKQELIQKISYIMTELNVLHPFREGNGRAIREFIRELANELGYKLDLFKVDYDEVIRVSKMAVIDEKEQIKLIEKIIVEIERG